MIIASLLKTNSVELLLPVLDHVRLTQMSGDGLDFGGLPAHHASLVNASAVLTPVPEPSTWALMVFGLAGAMGARRLKRA